MNLYDHVVDVMSVPAMGDPSAAIHRVNVTRSVPDVECDVLIVGGGTGGTAATMASARLGMATVMLEETDWIGGQFTAQGVSALDEHEHIESFGGTATYYLIREGIRDHYRHAYPSVRKLREFNPGRSWVTRLAFEPSVALRVVRRLLTHTVAARRPLIQLRTKVIGADAGPNGVRAVLGLNFETGAVTRYLPRIVIDATEFGDLLPLCGVEHIVGAEDRADTGEAHARPTGACADCVQSVTYPAVLRLGDASPIESPPPMYERYRDAQPYSLRIHVTGGEIYSDSNGWLQYDLFDRMPGTRGGLWSYRRLVDRLFLGPPAQADISIMNWPGNDFRDRSLLTSSATEFAESLQRAKWVSLGFVHWLRTEARSRKGRSDFPEPGPAPDVYQTVDGLAKHPYVREGRRILPMRRILEGDVSATEQPGAAASPMPDAVGVGWYPIDIHAAHQEELAVSVRTRPFQIPLTALIPRVAPNILAAAKNIGTTHITNGCYRLHPIEWNIGEAAGTAAAVAMRHNTRVQSVAADATLLLEVQRALLDAGVPLNWIVDVPIGHRSFAAVQMAALRGDIDPRDIDLRAEHLSFDARRRLGV